MPRIVVGLFDEIAQAQGALEELVQGGVAREEISVITGQAGASDGPGAARREGRDILHGAETGALVGGLTGLLLALSPIAAPGLGPVLIGGGLFAALVGAGVGAVTGSIHGALIEHGVSEQEAHHYSEGVRRGGTLVAVRTPESDEARIIALLQRRGAVDIHERAALWAQEP